MLLESVRKVAGMTEWPGRLIGKSGENSRAV